MSVEAPASAETQALQRAMPLSRLLDCGMLRADAEALHERTSRGEAWHAVARSIGEARRARADGALHLGDVASARAERAAAVGAFVFAQMAINFDTDLKRQLYAELASATAEYAEVSENPLERVEVAFDHRALSGWLLRPPKAALGTVLLFGGQSGWGPAYLPAALALADRGLATLLAEGPGQGETRMVGGVHLDVDVDAGFGAFVDRMVEDPALGRVGVWGNSMGGLWAATLAARDGRISACCVNSGFAKPRLLPFRAFAEQAAAMLGTDDPQLIQANFDRLALRETDRIACPLLVLHGGADPLLSLEDQQPFLDAAHGREPTLRTWPDGDHTIYNHSVERTAFVADWFGDILSQGTPA